MKQRAKAGKAIKEVSADYKAELEGLKLYTKITGLSDETAERLKRREVIT